MWTTTEIHVPVHFANVESSLEEVGRLGFSVELQGLHDANVFCRDFESNVASIERAFSGFSAPVTVHGPFIDLSPISDDMDIASVTRRRYEQALELARAAGASRLLFHSQCSTYIRDRSYLGDWLEKSAAYWSGWQDHLEGESMTVLIENVFEEGWEPLAALIDRLGNPRFGACLDLGHAHLFSGDATAWIRGLASRIAHVHLHDNDGEFDLHLPPGEGAMDIPACLDGLAGLAEKPTLTVEVQSREGILRTLDWLRDKGYLEVMG
jgi:sugar phosphate isomerase/epimerase